MAGIKNREGFTFHAAPSAIRDAMRRAEQRMNEARNEYLWLKSLLDERLRQMGEGQWPKPRGDS
jgi:hypothetical protein